MNARHEEYQNLICQLRAIDIEDLLMLYIEAKTGDPSDIDRLPVRLLDAVEELDEYLSIFFGERIFNNVRKGQP